MINIAARKRRSNIEIVEVPEKEIQSNGTNTKKYLRRLSRKKKEKKKDVLKEPTVYLHILNQNYQYQDRIFLH